MTSSPASPRWWRSWRPSSGPNLLRTCPRASPESRPCWPARLRDDGFRVRRIGGRGRSGGLLEASPPRRRGSPYQLLIGHTDTVWPVGTLSRMPVDIAQETVAGPGAVRHEGRVGPARLRRLRSLHGLGVDLTVTPVVLLNSDEEIGSGESRPWISRFARRATRCFVLEPALGPSGKLKTARKGAGEFAIRIEGRSAHAGLDPTAGAGAILELSYVIQTLQALNDPARRDLGERGPDRRRSQAQRRGSRRARPSSTFVSPPGPTASGSRPRSAVSPRPCRGPGSSSRGPWTSRRWSRPPTAGGSGSPRVKPLSGLGSSLRRRSPAASPTAIRPASTRPRSTVWGPSVMGPTPPSSSWIAASWW